MDKERTDLRTVEELCEWLKEILEEKKKDDWIIVEYGWERPLEEITKSSDRSRHFRPGPRFLISIELEKVLGEKEESE